MSAAEPLQSANSAPAGGSAAAQRQAGGDHTSAHVAQGATSLRHVATIALEALRDIRRPQVLAAVLFGLVVSVANTVSLFVMFVVKANPISRAVQVADLLIQDQIRAFALMAAVVIADRVVDLGAPMRRSYVAAALGGSLLGVVVSAVTRWPFWAWMQVHGWPAHWLRGIQGFVFGALFDLTYWLLIASAAVFLYADRRAARRTEARLHASELDRIRRSKVALESRLQAMQARVEPRFLLNTLAQVERLFELDPALAARMLDDLIAYLRAAMPLMRDTSSTVAQEIELARAYLDIVRLRLGDRLAVRIEVPREVAPLRMPPMMLLPLIDHAVVRGLEPSTAGGTISVRAVVDGGRLHLTIADSGAGFVPTSDGDGIAAIRERLEALYRGDATLDLRRRSGDPTLVVLDLPLEQGVTAP
jgi:hypothetical protein